MGNKSYRFIVVAISTMHVGVLIERETPETPMRSSTAETLPKQSSSKLGKQLFDALSADEQKARLVLAFFELPATSEAGRSDAPSLKARKQAAIARLLEEYSIKRSPQLMIKEWRVDKSLLPDFDQIALLAY